MKVSHLLLSSIIFLFLFSCRNEQDKNYPAAENGHVDLSSGGSTTLLPVMLRAQGPFQQAFPSYRLSYGATGSNAGFESLVKGEIDFALLSRSVSDEERASLAGDKRGELNVNIIAYDGISIIANISNPVRKITREQLADIWSGKILNWSELGGPNKPILVFSRDENSGTYEYFNSKVLDSAGYGKNVKRKESNEDILDAVIQNEGAIGYVSIGYVKPEVHSMALSFDQGKTFIEDTWQNLREDHYPLTRPLYCAFFESNKAKVWPFVHFILSEEGQAVVWQAGYLPFDRH